MVFMNSRSSVVEGSAPGETLARGDSSSAIDVLDGLGLGGIVLNVFRCKYENFHVCVCLFTEGRECSTLIQLVWLVRCTSYGVYN